MRRGDIWTASGGNDYAGKPRPVVIVQDDSFDSTASITVEHVKSIPIWHPGLGAPEPRDFDACFLVVSFRSDWLDLSRHVAPC